MSEHELRKEIRKLNEELDNAYIQNEIDKIKISLLNLWNQLMLVRKAAKRR